MNWEVWGILAGIVTLTGFVPQIIKAYKSKKLTDLSYSLNIFIGIGMLMWVIYGFAINSFSVIITNIVGVCLNFLLTGMKFYYSLKEK